MVVDETLGSRQTHALAHAQTHPRPIPTSTHTAQLSTAELRGHNYISFNQDKISVPRNENRLSRTLAKLSLSITLRSGHHLIKMLLI